MGENERVNLLEKEEAVLSLFFGRKERDFEQLAAQQEKNVYLTCLHMMGNPEDAQDCAQETMLKAYRAFSSFRGESQFGTWISRIAVNVCRDALRARRQVVSLDALREDGFDVPDERVNVYAQMDQKERMRLLKDALQLLPEDMKTVLVLRDIKGCSMEDMSRILSLPEGTVKSRLNRARKKICQLLAQNMELFDGKSV